VLPRSSIDRSLQLDAALPEKIGQDAVDDGGRLGFDIVTIIGRPFSANLSPSLSAGDETGMQ